MTAAHMVYLRKQGAHQGIEVTGPGVRSDWYPATFAPAVARAMKCEEWDSGWPPVADQIRTQLAVLAAWAE